MLKTVKKTTDRRRYDDNDYDDGEKRPTDRSTGAAAIKKTEDCDEVDHARSHGPCDPARTLPLHHL